jgi:hypothetical protein
MPIMFFQVGHQSIFFIAESDAVHRHHAQTNLALLSGHERLNWEITNEKQVIENVAQYAILSFRVLCLIIDLPILPGH